MPSNREKDRPGVAPSPSRSEDEIALDEFADEPLGGTKLLNWLTQYPGTNDFPSAQELQKLSRHLIDHVFQHWQFVNHILQRHEETIRKRWIKKTVKQRREILLAVEPDMPEHHRPENSEFWRLQAKFNLPLNIETPPYEFLNSKTCMLPHINLEDLSRPKTMLIFLNARGRNHPATFAHTELMNCPLHAWEDEPLWGKLDGWTMQFAELMTEESYGQMKQWTDKDGAQHFVRTGQGFHPARGMQVINIQLSTCLFLRAWCNKILHDIKDDIFAHRIQPEPPSLSPSTTNYSSLGDTALYSPYMVPAQLDFQRLRGLITAEKGALEDHIWALREDPGYFLDVFQNHVDHRTEYVRATTGQKHDIVKKPAYFMTNFVLRNLVLDPYIALYHWHECLRLVGVLEKKARQFNFQFVPNKSLPKDYYDTFLKLWQVLYAIHTDIHECFRQRIPASPPLRPFFVKTYADKLSHRSVFKIDEVKASKNPITRRFFDVLPHIWLLPDMPPIAGFYTELDELERLVTTEPAAKELISSFVWADFSQLSTSSECIHQIRQYQPWATQMEFDMSARRTELLADYLDFTGKWGRICTQKHLGGTELARLGDPSDGKFRYPIDERRNRTNTRALRFAEDNLDAFWKAADAYCKKTTGATLQGLLSHDITEGRALRRTIVWVDPPKTRKTPTASPLSASQDTYLPFSLLDHDRATEITGTFDKRTVCTEPKAKTRGTVETVDGGAPSVVLTSSNTESTSPIPMVVDKRTHKVFKALFFSPFSSDTPGEVQWSDFLHAMTKTGFSAEKLRGSAWKFTPTELGVDHSIQFHEPHPVSKLPLKWARRYGRRLEMAYGWTGETFILA